MYGNYRKELENARAAGNGGQQNLGIWRHSPSRSTSPVPGDRRSPSPLHGSVSSNSSSLSNESARNHKLSRRPIPGKVAALQQHHQWLMQQQQQQQQRSVSPKPSVSANRRSADMLPSSPVKSRVIVLQGNEPSRSGSRDERDERDEEHSDIRNEDDAVEDEDVHGRRVISDTASAVASIVSNARSDRSFLSGISTTSSSPSASYAPTSGSQEFRVAREGWLYKKNSLMQWRPVYAVAKHGNAIKPSGLYLYKDDKFSSHIHTYDMSEAVEVEPRAQEYKAGVKWELRILVKREDIILATDDLQSRKEWIDALTSIMGKVSIATHTELQTRMYGAEQHNRDLQSTNENLRTENQSLRDQLIALEESISKKEAHIHDECLAREEDLVTELDHMRQTMDTRCDLLEREMSAWQSKAQELEDIKVDKQDQITSLELEIRKWKARVEELEDMNADFHRKESRSKAESYYNGPSGYSRYKSTSNDSNSITDAVTDMKYNLQSLRDLIKSSGENQPLLQSHVLDIKAGVNKLCESLEEARTGWSDLQADIIKFVEAENEHGTMKDNRQAQALEQLKQDFDDLREELVGGSDTSADEGSVGTSEGSVDDNQESVRSEKSIGKERLSLSSKFDVLTQMVEMLQLSQNRLLTMYTEKDETENSSEQGMESVASMVKDIQEKIDVMQSSTSEDKETSMHHQQQELSSSLEDLRSEVSMMLMKLDELREAKEDSLQSQDITESIRVYMDDFKQNQQQGREEYERSLKVLGQLFQHVISQIKESSIPDLPALSEQLETTVERLMVAEERLTRMGLKPSNHRDSGIANEDDGQDLMEFRNLERSKSDAIDLDDIRTLVVSTRAFMERSLRILDRFGGSNAGMEETVRRAVKSAFNSHLNVDWQEPGKNKHDNTEEKLKRYEENAREYIDKSMTGMREHLEEYTGVLYKMIEDLILRAVDHLQSRDTPSNLKDGQAGSDGTDRLIELHSKLSGAKQALEMDIERLQEERSTLQSDVDGLKYDSGKLKQELDEKRKQLHELHVEYDRVSKEMQRSREDTVVNLTRDMEPLIRQIAKLKQMASLGHDLIDDNNSTSGFVDVPSSRPRGRSPSPQPPPRTQHTKTDNNGFFKSSHDTPSSLADRSWNTPRNSYFDASKSRPLPEQPKSTLSGGRPRIGTPLVGLTGHKE
ncbi:uncharacterized protein BYT42DRAFT_643883 [Radiomyces spectabilis]|uniref:uncharacterized protein n=1 Tax=Radiomyces spectabilis TaxID=64574 RepID=UPI00221E8355|nr:uncharacterized protein BYT42DRAFT_643883 [Radiomyces spectabilis]KAI8381009.1 hypothetical protein BYT42DRAFT_643883 [Radiomyces spectabilis]